MLFLLPLVCCAGMHFGVGGIIKGMQLGVVNDEVPNNNDCANSSLITFRREGVECVLNKVSCRFIQEFDEDIAKKVRSIFKIFK